MTSLKPMPYTPVEKRDDGLDMYMVYRVGAGARVWTLGHTVDDLIEDKKLTDAECAAEYWRAEADHCSMRNGEGVGWSTPGLVASLADEVETWHRFATLPHAV